MHAKNKEKVAHSEVLKSLKKKRAKWNYLDRKTSDEYIFLNLFHVLDSLVYETNSNLIDGEVKTSNKMKRDNKRNSNSS